MSDAELRVLGFCVLMHNDPVLSDATHQLGVLGYNRALKLLSVLLGLTLTEVRTCLSRDGQPDTSTKVSRRPSRNSG